MFHKQVYYLVSFVKPDQTNQVYHTVNSSKAMCSQHQQRANPKQCLFNKSNIILRFAPSKIHHIFKHCHINTFDNDAAVPGFTSLPPVDAEELFSGFVFSTVCVLLIPDTLGTEPTLLLAFFILGCLFVMHLQANLWKEMALY